MNVYFVYKVLTNRIRALIIAAGYIYVARAHAAKPPCHTHVRHVNSAVRSGDSYKTENADDGKAKSRDTRRNELRSWNERETSEPLHTCASLSVSPCILGFLRTSVFLAGYFTQTPFHTFLHKHNMCTLHSGQDLRTRNAYGAAKTRPSRLACRLRHSSGSPPAMIIICLVVTFKRLQRV